MSSGFTSPSFINSAYPEIVVNGVFSSWDTLAENSLRIFSASLISLICLSISIFCFSILSSNGVNSLYVLFCFGCIKFIWLIGSTIRSVDILDNITDNIVTTARIKAMIGMISSICLTIVWVSRLIRRIVPSFNFTA